MFFSK